MSEDMKFDVKTLQEYGKLASATAIYPRERKVVYPVLGLTGEAGEVAEKVKKMIRDKGGEPDEEFFNDMKKELGDVLWYVNAAARDCGWTLEDLANANLEKLYSRKKRGKISGSGDDR